MCVCVSSLSLSLSLSLSCFFQLHSPCPPSLSPSIHKVCNIWFFPPSQCTSVTQLRCAHHMSHVCLCSSVALMSTQRSHQIKPLPHSCACAFRPERNVSPQLAPLTAADDAFAGSDWYWSRPSMRRGKQEVGERGGTLTVLCLISWQRVIASLRERKTWLVPRAGILPRHSTRVVFFWYSVMSSASM